MVEIDLAHARLDERQREPGVELEHVVCYARRDQGDVAELAPTLLLDLEADELEGVVLTLRGRWQRLARNGELRATGRLAVQSDHRPAA